jgi:sugar lactone lactonase YvrE
MRSAKSPSSANVTKVADVPEAQLLNGMIALDQSGNVLIADSGAGVIWRVNTRSGDVKTVVDDPLMKPVAGAPAAIGVNGIKIRKGNLFFTNTFGMTFSSVPIHKDGTAIGAAKVIVKNGIGDDFTFDKSGNALVAQNVLNTLEKITPGGKQVTVVAGNLNSTQLAGPTAAQFGRTKKYERTLYVTTNGGLAGPINGTFIEGGQVVAIDSIA